MDHHVWDQEVDQWLDDLMDVMEDMFPKDIGDLLEGMSPEDWEQWMERIRLIWMCLFLKKRQSQTFQFLFSQNNKGCKHRCGVIIESQASFFQEAHVRFAVRYQFFLEIEDYVFVALLFMPLFQGFLGFRRHGFGHAVVEDWEQWMKDVTVPFDLDVFVS